MDKFVSYDKMSKKEKKKIDSAKRGSWNGVDPATKMVDTDKKRYRRTPKTSENSDE